MKTVLAKGSCLCRQHRVQAIGEPFWISYCHCRDCRKATGAPATVFVGFHEDDVKFDNRPSVYSSSPSVERLFCGRCGTPLGYRDKNLAGEIYLLVGIFEGPELFQPERHAWVSEQLPWLHIEDELPRHAEFSRPRSSGKPE